MGESPEFCRHPGDLEGCMASLIEAFRAGALDKHSIMTGLPNGHPQCLQVLACGLKGGQLRRKARWAQRAAADQGLPAQPLPLPTAACQAALHLALQKGIRAAEDFFVEFYKILVCSALSRQGLLQDEAEVVFQDVFLAMTTRLKNPKPFRGRLSVYLWQVVRNQSAKFREHKTRREQQRAELEAEGSPVSAAPTANALVDVPTQTIEWWEDLDSFLKSRPHDMFVERILLAQAFVLTGEFKKRSPTKSILALWRKLAGSDETALAPIAREATVRLALSPETTIAWIAADMLREGSALVWHLPVILGQDIGMTAAQVLTLARDLANKPGGYVDTCAFALEHLLAEHIRRELWNVGKE